MDDPNAIWRIRIRSTRELTAATPDNHATAHYIDCDFHFSPSMFGDAALPEIIVADISGQIARKFPPPAAPKPAQRKQTR
jgi:hypothetical protein